MRIIKDPRLTTSIAKSQLLLIEIANNSFTESGIATELEGL
jgi:hypothetical protein